MEKPAPADHPILDVLGRRWSPRAFASRAVEAHKVRCLFEAVRWSASSYNEQPWSFVATHHADSDAFSQAISCLAEANRSWASSAGMLVFTFARPTFVRNNKPNSVCLHDVGLAVGNLTIQATSMGLFVHQMAGILPDAIRELYDVPAEHDPVTAIAIGYAGEAGSLPAELLQAEQAPRDRKQLSEFLFTGKWGTGLEG
jgi:nitroreductase